MQVSAIEWDKVTISSEDPAYADRFYHAELHKSPDSKLIHIRGTPGWARSERLKHTALASAEIIELRPWLMRLSASMWEEDDQGKLKLTPVEVRCMILALAPTEE